ncbi:hypothetical protein EK904_009921, partial [Melospiza melodia maxima]
MKIKCQLWKYGSTPSPTSVRINTPKCTHRTTGRHNSSEGKVSIPYSLSAAALNHATFRPCNWLSTC